MSLVGYRPWGHKESNTTEQLTLLLFLQVTLALFGGKQGLKITICTTCFILLGWLFVSRLFPWTELETTVLF